MARPDPLATVAQSLARPVRRQTRRDSRPSQGPPCLLVQQLLCKGFSTPASRGITIRHEERRWWRAACCCSGETACSAATIGAATMAAVEKAMAGQHQAAAVVAADTASAQHHPTVHAHHRALRYQHLGLVQDAGVQEVDQLCQLPGRCQADHLHRHREVKVTISDK